MISWLEKNSKLSWTITTLIAILIFYISSLTFETGGGGGSNLKAVLYHIIIFFIFSFFLSISIVKGIHKGFILLVIFISIVYGISDEIHQLFVPGRYFSIQDILFDSTGILFASIIYLISLEYRNNC